MRGSALTGPNRIVPAPDAETARATASASRVASIHCASAPGHAGGLVAVPAFNGLTAGLAPISCHASVLQSGHSPHPPHTHLEEEILLLLSGEVEIELAEGATERLQPEEFVYYPVGFAHTLKTTSPEPATYVMFKWRGSSTPGSSEAPPLVRALQRRWCRSMFEGPTKYLRKLHSHITVLEPGGGYAPHADAYDVAIVVLEGEVETIGGRAAPYDVIFYRAGEGARHAKRRERRRKVRRLRVPWADDAWE